MAKRKLRIGHEPGRPLLLDAFSCAGGSAMGFHQAKFNIVGVDENAQPNYPFEHHVGDALEFLTAVIGNRMRLDDGRRVHAVNASPPCQFYSTMSNCRPGLRETYPDLIGPTRELLQRSGVPWVIEQRRGGQAVDA